MDGAGSRVTALARQRARMRLAPVATVTELLFEALGRPMGSPSFWPGTVREALEPRDVAVLGPVYGPDGSTFVPSCLLPQTEDFLLPFDDELDRVAAVSSDELRTELVKEGLLGTAWSTAAKAPSRWLDAYLQALRRAWLGVRPIWDRAMPLLEREVERVGVALARQSFDQLIDGLHPRGHVEGGRWLVGADREPAALAPELILQPMVIGPRSALMDTTNGKVSYLAYPLPGSYRLVDPQRPALATSAVAALLGAPRAQILHRLDRPAFVGELSTEMAYSPGAITHHLIVLERTGLVIRERIGQRVLVYRTARGSALLHLYQR